LTSTPTPTTGPTAVTGKAYLYPSPVRGGSATLLYVMAGPGKAHIRIYNEVGDLVDSLQEDKGIGQQSTVINFKSMAPGVYHYFLNLTYDSGASDSQSVKKFVVLD
jgi:hypothetical protein